MQTYLFGIGILYKLRYYVSMNTLKQLYYTLICPYRNYGSMSWGTACQTKFKKIKISHIIIWLAPRAGKMSQILRCDWLPERARWSYLARSGLPVARPLGIESLMPTTMQSFRRFSRCFAGKSSLNCSVKLSTFT